MNDCAYEIVNATKTCTENETKKVKWPQKPLVRQLMVSSCVGGAFFQMGLYLGACPVLVAQLRKEPLQDGVVVHDEEASWISSTGAFSAIPSVLLLALIAESFGRRSSFLFVSITTCVSFVIFYCATSFKMLIIALILQGPLLGGSSIVCLPIASECVSPKYRGVFLSIHAATIGWAVWLANAIGTFFHWKNIGIIGISSAVYTTLMMTLCSESPFWLASKGKVNKCQEAHRWYRGTDDSAVLELESLIKSETERSRKIKRDRIIYQRLSFYIKKVQATEFYQPMGLCVLLTLMAHLSGKFVLSMYAIDIIKKITDNETAAYTGMLMVDGITVLGMYLGTVVSKYIKRRTLFFSSEFLALCFLLTLSLYLFLIKIGLIKDNVYLSITLLLAFSLSYCGVAVVTNPLLGELMPLEMRTLAAIMHCVAANVIGGISLKVAPWVFSSCGPHGAFLFFAVGSLVCTMILLKYLPETNNKSLEDIESFFKGNKKIKQSVPLAQPTCATNSISPSCKSF